MNSFPKSESDAEKVADETAQRGDGKRRDEHHREAVLDGCVRIVIDILHNGIVAISENNYSTIKANIIN